MNPNHRQIALLHAPTVADALTQSQALCPIETLTTIDMNRDFNQNKWLGQELGDTLIYFNNDSKPNGLLAVLGCVKAPHYIIFACDNVAISDVFKRDIFLPEIERLIKEQTRTKAVDVPYPIAQSAIVAEKSILNNGKKSRPSISDNQPNLQGKKDNHNEKVATFSSRDFECETSDETEYALEQLKHAKGVIHLTGERGSGKSTLLGLFVRNEISAGQGGFVLSSPVITSSKNTLKAGELDNVSRETFLYVPREILLSECKNSQTIIIDEAATFPNATLNKVIAHACKHSKKLILSTTIEGYEGTGQSYRLNYLTTESRDFFIRLEQPKRFANDDPIHQLCQNLYHPDTTIANASGSEILTTAELKSRDWTKACFALLREAHYKTTPNDLARFYSDEAIFAVCIADNAVVAAAYALPEQLPSDINARDILYGKRRAKNAFTHQALLTAYAELSNVEQPNKSRDFLNVNNNHYFINSKILRISRIAVAKTHRRKGMATQLITQLKEKSRDLGFDFLSTSFGGSAENIAFWQSQNFTPARVGLYPNKANHDYAVLMLFALNNDAEYTETKSRDFFYLHLQYFFSVYPAQIQALLNEGLSKNKPESEVNSKTESRAGETITIEMFHVEQDSVLNGYRDVNWLLPILKQVATAQYMGQDRADKVATLCNGKVYIKSQWKAVKALLNDGNW